MPRRKKQTFKAPPALITTLNEITPCILFSFILVSVSELHALSDIFLELTHEEHVTERIIRIARRVSSIPTQLDQVKKDITPILCILLIILLNLNIDPYGMKMPGTDIPFYGINC